MHHRRSIRLPGFDYTQPGQYFVTLVTADRLERFGQIINGVMRLNAVGEMAQREWLRLVNRFPGLELYDYAFMPNHFHGILSLPELTGTDKPQTTPGEGGSLGAMIKSYKSCTTYRFHQIMKSSSCSLWQRNYYEHIIRGTKDFDIIRTYIIENPLRWEEDRENPVKTV